MGDAAERLFYLIDTDGDGAISREELSSFLLKSKTDPNEISRMFSEIDKNKDGKISKEEWTEGYASYASRLPDPHQPTADLEYSTPMLVMSVSNFMGLGGKIFKSTKAWRND